MVKTVRKKAYRKYFEKVMNGEKLFDVRLADFSIESGDILELIETDDETGKPTGRTLRSEVGTVLRTKDVEKLGWFLPEDIDKYGYQVIGLKNSCEKRESNEGAAE